MMDSTTATATTKRETYTQTVKEGSGSSLGTTVDSGYTSRSSHSTAPSTVPSVKIFHSAQEYQEYQRSCQSSEERRKKKEEDSPCASRNTYVSTLDSLEERDHRAQQDSAFEPDYFDQYLPPPLPPLYNDATPSDPTQFARLFPSKSSFIIKHDDSVPDGHMNLRLDTVYERPGRRDRKLTLFYLRMYELETRHFAIRRYGRDCGREVANTSRKFTKPSTARPGLPRTVSKAFQSFRGKGEMYSPVRRQDSGGLTSDSEHEGGSDKEDSQETNTITLDFSNYARIDLSRKGRGEGNKRYDFEYWGKDYTWKRHINREGINDITILTLVDNATNQAIARISPLEDDTVSMEERARGRFVPKSELRFCVSEREIRRGNFADLADVVVSTGLLTLVDDCLKRLHQKQKKSVAFSLPTPSKTPTKIHLEYVGAKKLIDEVFKRPSRPTSPTKQATTPVPSPVRNGVLRTMTTAAQGTPTRKQVVRSKTSPPSFSPLQHHYQQQQQGGQGYRSPVFAQ